MVSSIMSNYNSIFSSLKATLGVASALALTVGLTACNSSDGALKSSVSEKPIVAPQPVSTGAPEIKRLSGKGGTKIAYLVNDTPITTNDINRRVAFVKLRRMKGNKRKIATDELINEAIKMKEARRIRAVASNKEVDAAFVRFAKGNKMPVKVLGKVLDQRGVTRRGFKEFIRAQMSWQRAVGARLQAEAAGRGGSQTNTGPAWLSNATKESKLEAEYTLQQVVFIIPAKKRSSLLNRRKSEATRFRAKMQGCNNARSLASGLTDVSVLDRGRVRAHQLPANWKAEIQKLSAGQVSRPKVTNKGVELLAVCRTRELRSTAPAGSEVFASGNLQKAASALEKKYLAELKQRAVIKRR